jgi:1-deoxy-D-xylulose-5-phosphate reductoisomerase
MRSVAILGATGSIGVQALEVVAANPGLRVCALSANRDADGLAAAARATGARHVALADAEAARTASSLDGVTVFAGEGGVEELIAASGADLVLNAIVGAAGLRATVAAFAAGADVALANKESLVAGGELVLAAQAAGGRLLLPVDSEHSALWQCLDGAAPGSVAGLVITASGGPFRGRSADELADVSSAEALAHPTWRMGQKITIDSATLMNKGLEVIEAHHLFSIPYEAIEVVVHPQSIVHGMVEWVDGSTMAQLSRPDMRLPIGYALAAPDRVPQAVGVIDWTRLGTLTFEAPDLEAFPCLGLAYRAARAGGDVPATLNAANEVAVAAFLDGRLSWPGIAEVVQEVLEEHTPGNVETLDDVVDSDGRARRRAEAAVERRSAA